MIKSLAFAVIFASIAAFAGPHEDLKARENVSEKARARLYEGGADEQPLVVQQSLVEPRADGSESMMQKKLNSEGGEATESTDETTSGF